MNTLKVDDAISAYILTFQFILILAQQVKSDFYIRQNSAEIHSRLKI